jgi:hypothetical protein
MNRIYSKTICLIFFTAAFFILPHFASAQSIALTSAKTSYKIGDTITITLKIDTGDYLINAIEGTVQLPSRDYFEVKTISTGSSILSMWPDFPALHYLSGDGNCDGDCDGNGQGKGEISFTGGLLGGFKGLGGNIMAITLKAKKAATSAIYFNNSMVLLNDGLGTELENVKITPLTLAVKKK